MADYPALAIAPNFTETIRDGRQVDQSADGLARVRKLHADRRDFMVTHQFLSLADFATWQTFYAANSGGTFNFTTPVDAVTYACAFSGPPQIRRELTYPRRVTVTVKLSQVS